MTLGNRRTSVSLEGHIWEALTDVCRREALSVDALCTAVAERRVRSSMSSSLRIFVLLYFRGLAEDTDADPSTGSVGRLAVTLERYRAAEVESDRG